VVVRYGGRWEVGMADNGIELGSMSNDELHAAIDAAPTQAEKKAIGDFLKARLQLRRKDALKSFSANSKRLADLTEQLKAVIDGLPVASNDPRSTLMKKLSGEAQNTLDQHFTK
jgi:hypothetical protein